MLSLRTFAWMLLGRELSHGMSLGRVFTARGAQEQKFFKQSKLIAKSEEFDTGKKTQQAFQNIRIEYLLKSDEATRCWYARGS